MFRFLILFGLAAIVLMLVVAYVRGRSGGSSGRGALGDGAGGAAAAGWSTDWDGRPADVTHDSDAGDAGGGGTDGSGGGGSDGGGSDGGGGGGGA